MTRHYYARQGIKAQPMALREYEKFAGYSRDSSEDRPGYLVQHTNADSNTSAYQGYVLWMDAADFEAVYKPVEMPAGLSLEHEQLVVDAARAADRFDAQEAFLNSPESPAPRSLERDVLEAHQNALRCVRTVLAMRIADLEAPHG